MSSHDVLQPRKTKKPLLKGLEDFVKNKVISIFLPTLLLTAGNPFSADHDKSALKDSNPKQTQTVISVNNKEVNADLSDEELLTTSAYEHSREAGFLQTQKEARPDTLKKFQFPMPIINGDTAIKITSEQKARAIVINGVYYPAEQHPGTDIHALKNSRIALSRKTALVNSYVEHSTNIGHLVVDAGNNFQEHLLHQVLSKSKPGHEFEPGETITKVAGKYLYGESKEQVPHLHIEMHYVDPATGKDTRLNSTEILRNKGLYVETEESSTAKRLGRFVSNRLFKSKTEQEFDETAEVLQNRLAKHQIRQKTYDACMVSYLQAKQMIHENALANMRMERNERQSQFIAAVNGVFGEKQVVPAYVFRTQL